ncbi:MAG: 23S rRNA (uracil1939-C5)-methyltransferase [Bradymonadia bacterium]|jgi:23S rRNA (uracil1939-C5)-methyltransferase
MGTTTHTPPYAVHELIACQIAGVTAEGVGYAHCRGADEHPWTLRVPGTAPGDLVRVGVEAWSRYHFHGWARVDAIVSRSDAFREAPCPHAAPLNGKCGGCAVQHISEDAQRTSKRERVIAALASEGLPTSTVADDVHATAAWNYRNRAQFLIGFDGDGPFLGSRIPGSRRMARMQGCAVMRPELRRVALAAERAIGSHPRSQIRFVSMRCAQDGSTLLELICGSEDPISRAIADDLSHSADGVLFSINESKGNVVRGAAPEHVHGLPHVSHTLGDVTWQVDTVPFLQLNHEIGAKLVADVVSLAGTPKVTWDLYGGIGAFGLPIAKASDGEVVLIERDGRALEAARVAGAGLPAEFIQAALTDKSLGFNPRSLPTPDLVVVDPPRKGLGSAVRELLAEVAAPIISVSCNPETFAADVAFFVQRGWRLGEVRLYDMLPQTPQVELVARLQPPSAPAK